MATSGSSDPTHASEGRRDARTRLAALVLACLPALVGVPAAWLDLRENTYPDGYRERLLALEVGIAGVALFVLAVGTGKIRAGQGLFRALAAGWVLALLLAQPSILSPQLTSLLFCQLVMVLFVLAQAVRPSRLVLGVQVSFLAASSALLLAELWLGEVVEKRLPDYGDLGGPAGRLFPGGSLKPGLDLQVIGDGPHGRVRVVTSSDGFRNRDDHARTPPESTARTLFAGDSFFAGYRVDQEEMAGAVLERELNESATDGRRAEVLVSRVDNPVLCQQWLVEHGLSFQPDLLIVGVTLGNDVGDCWLALHPRGPFTVTAEGEMPRIEPNASRARIGFRTPPLSEDFLPGDAFLRDPNPVVDRLFHYLRAASGKLIRLRTLALVSPSSVGAGIGSWYSDPPRRVHTFDLTHGLGSYYARSPLPTVEEGFDCLEAALLGIRSACSESGVALLVALIPQRFEIDALDWGAAVKRYGLDPAAFDLGRPARRLGRFLREHSIESVDLAPPLRRRAASAPLYLPRGDMHWNHAGHRVAGEALAAAVRERDLLRGRR